MVAPNAIKEEYLPVLKKLRELNKPVEAKELSELLEMDYGKLMSYAVHSLSTQGLVVYSEENIIEYRLTDEGKEYVQKGLPERQLYSLLRKDGRTSVVLPTLVEEAETELDFDKKIFYIALGNMKRHRWVLSSKAMGHEEIFLNDKNESAEKVSQEEALDLFQKTDRIKEIAIPPEMSKAVNLLYKRKLLTRERYTERLVKLTKAGAAVDLGKIEVIDKETLQITPEMLKGGTWKEALNALKPYNVEAEAPRQQVGKYHPMTIIIHQIREIFHSMGFEEIQSPIVETAFYNFDSLYQPQDHPARELHDTFYLKNPSKGRLPEKKYVTAVKNTHENGGETGSTGWRYKWSEKIAQKCLLRTHTTASTIRKLGALAQSETKWPKKVFCIDRVFRNERLDRTHLAEFQQIEGIVIGENLTLSDLIGQITTFYKKMGFKKVVTRPGFFPYTEPSMEIAVYSEELGQWLEMGGSGIFRPEVTYPWGIKEPVRVLAWGMGLERLAMLKLKRQDIRELYQSPIDWLREVKY